MNLFTCRRIDLIENVHVNFKLKKNISNIYLSNQKISIQ